MKIYHLSKLVILSITLFITASTLKLNRDIQLYQMPYDPTKFNILSSPSTIQEMFFTVKKTGNDGGAGVKECYNLIFKSKYQEPLKTFWDEVGKVCVKEADIISRDLYINLLKNTDEAVVIEGVNKKCQDVLTSNMLGESDFKNPAKQRELRTVMEPFFSPPRKPVDLSKKNIITAFIGVHRGTEQSDTLIQKLNKMNGWLNKYNLIK